MIMIGVILIIAIMISDINIVIIIIVITFFQINIIIIAISFIMTG